MTKGLSANELDIKISGILRSYDIGPIFHHLELVGDGQKLEVMNQAKNGDTLYYQYLACMVRFLQPRQVVELGAANGVSSIMMLTEMPKDSKLYSVDIDPSIAWKWMKHDYPQLVKVLGDDLNMAIWPGDVDLGKTDLWFIDTLHLKGQLEKELALYKPYFNKSAVVVLDDIRIPGMWEVWEGLPYDKL